MKVLIVVASFLVSSAWAQRYNDVVYVDVIDAQPIIETVSVPERREICQRITEREQQRKHKNGGSILGGIIGGAIGGRDAATIAGVMIGASIGSQKDSRHNHLGRYGDVNTRCFIDTVYIEEEQLIGFDVSYRYNGELRYVEMQEHPGKQIKLRLDVSVIE